MQTLELVNIDDVYPFEFNDQRMNPRDFSTKQTREYVARLAEQFRSNRLNPGQPRVKPILYRDGGIYQIVDGECRYNAMRLLGTKRFWADVYDDLADAELARQEAAKAMVETDAKLCLSPTEMSRGVQTMLALDVPEEEVASASGVDVAKVRHVRRAARVVEDAAHDMTIDRLLAIADFEGDAEAVEQLSACAQKDWEGVYQQLCQERERERVRAEVRAKLEGLGVEVVDEAPEGMFRAGTKYVDQAVDALDAMCEGREGLVATVGACWVELWSPTDPDGLAKEADPEEQAREAEDERFREGWDRGMEERAAWVGSRAGDPSAMPSTATLLTDYALGSVESFACKHDVELPGEPSALAVCAGWLSVRWPPTWAARAVAHGGQPYLDRGQTHRAVEVYRAMVDDGYEPNDEEARAFDALDAWLGGGED